MMPEVILRLREIKPPTTSLLARHPTPDASPVDTHTPPASNFLTGAMEHDIFCMVTGDEEMARQFLRANNLLADSPICSNPVCNVPMRWYRHKSETQYVWR